jgi:hypothetical protein
MKKREDYVVDVAWTTKADDRMQCTHAGVTFRKAGAKSATLEMPCSYKKVSGVIHSLFRAKSSLLA